MRDVMRANENFDVDSEIVGMPEDFDHATDGPRAVFAEVDNFDVDNHSLEISNILYRDFARADAVR